MAIGQQSRYMSRTGAGAQELDVGLRNYMLKVYNYMALGVAFTGALGMLVATSPALLQLSVSMHFVWFLAILGLGWFAPRLMMTKSVATAQAVFWIYAAMWGMALGPMLALYAQMDPMLVARAFMITAATFAGMSLLGYTTKKNLAPMGAFLAMATIGILIALLVNVFFIESSGFQLLLSIAVVLIFSGLTAYETQVIKTMYYETDGGDIVARKAIFGAFMLYGSFVTLFVYILSILGIMRSE